MSRLSLCTIVFDEEPFIETMLESVKPLSPELIIGIDDRSTDRSEQICQEHGALTYPFTFPDDFAEARNEGLAKATGDWVLVIDPDEALTPIGVMVIKDILEKDARGEVHPYHGFHFLGAQMDLEGNVHEITRSSVRLFRNSPKIRYRGIVHEEVWVDGEEGMWCDVRNVVVMTHVGYDPRVYVGKHKHERNLALLKRRAELEPDNPYVQHKLAEESSMNEFGIEVS